MSMFLVRPRVSRPWWQKILIYLRNWVGWIFPALGDMFDDFMHVPTQSVIGLIVIGMTAIQACLWALYYFLAGPLGLYVAASAVIYLALGLSYHGFLLRMGGFYYEDE